MTFQKNPHAAENKGNQEIIHEMNLLKQQKTAKCQNKRVIKPQAASPFSGLSANCVFFFSHHTEAHKPNAKGKRTEVQVHLVGRHRS